MRAKATPGPWGIVTNRDGSINIVSPKDDEGWSHKIALVNNRNAANARLLAVAQEMAEALDTAPIMSKYHGHGFDADRFIADYEAWRVTCREILARIRGAQT